MISSTNNKLWRPKDKVSNPVWYPFSKLDDAHRNVSEKISSQSLSHLKMLTMPHDMVLETAHQFYLRAGNSNFLLSLSEHLLVISLSEYRTVVGGVLYFILKHPYVAETEIVYIDSKTCIYFPWLIELRSSFISIFYFLLYRYSTHVVIFIHRPDVTTRTIGVFKVFSFRQSNSKNNLDFGRFWITFKW